MEKIYSMVEYQNCTEDRIKVTCIYLNHCDSEMKNMIELYYKEVDKNRDRYSRYQENEYVYENNDDSSRGTFLRNKTYKYKLCFPSDNLKNIMEVLQTLGYIVEVQDEI